MIAAYLVILATLAGLVAAWLLARRRHRRNHHSIRYVIDLPNEADAARDVSPEA
jgi:hypothetical protein